MKKIVKRIGVIQLGKILAALYGFMGLLIVPFFLLFGAIAALAPQKGDAPPAIAVVIVSLVMAVGLPLFYALMGFLIGVIGAAMYNLIAKWLGGLELDIE